ncbi:MAG: AAA family ATPase [Pseudomonadota bacterium]|nr:AAA family ATPase [Pseudomonadota bacterium]
MEISEEAEVGGGCRDTLLHPNDFTEDGQRALKIAPGEGKHPLALFLDKDCEEKSFPTIFCGERRVDNNKRAKSITYSKICKQELRNQDRRVAHSIANIFFKLKKLQMLQIRDLATTALRKVKGKQPGYTAGQLAKEGAMESLLRQDEGYRVLKTLRSSPPYWQAKQKDLFAMLRQLGRPAFFATFSAAETRWPDLLRVLYQTEHGTELSDDDLMNLTWQEKSKLIQQDPVTCSRHFDYRIQILFRKVLLGELEPLGHVVDYFYRVEYQQRGSPHIHCLLWVENSPEADADNDEDVVAFVDKYLTCERHTEGELKEVSSLHEHKHSKSCKKGGKHKCRFGFPLAPMPQTMLLRPLSEDEEKKHPSRTTYLKNIKDGLKDLQPGEDISFEVFLARIGLTLDQYIIGLRDDLSSSKIFLERKPAESRMNTRNDALAQIWMANTDVQFVMDEYACGAYIITYISKGHRGMSDLLRDASDEAKRGNRGVQQQVRHIANKFLNHCEVSAQEAVYLLLQLPMCRATRDVIFINTSPPCDRVSLLKNATMLEMMNEDDTDITCTSLIDRYSDRPKELESVCLAEFATLFQVKRASTSTRRTTKKTEFQPEGEYEEENVDDIWDYSAVSGEVYKLGDGKILYRRTKPKVFRCVRFSAENEPEKHFRERLMLYLPWRDEEKDIIGGCETYFERYREMKKTVDEVESHFAPNGAAVDAAMERVEREGEQEDAWDEVAPAAQDLESRQEQFNKDSTDPAFRPQSDLHKNYDIGKEMGMRTADSDNITTESLVNRVSDEEYEQLVCSLNTKQQQFFLHVLHWIKTKCSTKPSESEPFHCFLSGGAGVGKSQCIRAIYHALVRYLSSRPGDNPDSVRVLLTAPTGKAAYNIRGVTLHTAFCIPANQSLKDYKNLDASRLNTLQRSFSGLSVLIIDEISMVGADMFNFVHQRLQQIMGTGNKRIFGGVSVLAVGDLFQLQPVMDRWVFQSSNTVYGGLALRLWQEFFTLFELTEIMRQKEDAQFAQLLNRVREGRHTEEDVRVIKSRVSRPPTNTTDPAIDNGQASNSDSVLHLFCKRKLVEAHNTKQLESLQTAAITITATDTVMGEVSAPLKEELLQKVRGLEVTQTQSLATQLLLKVDSRVMLVHNVDIADGLTNGAPGTLRQMGHRGDEDPSHVYVIWIQFDDHSVGQKTRQENRQLYTVKINSLWTPVFKAAKQFVIGRHKHISILRRQFPVAACAAITIHKSQGSTLEKVAVSFEGSTGAHLVYVALSRAKTLEGLRLLDFDAKKIKVSPDVRMEMERLREQPFHFCVPDLHQLGRGCFTAAFHNSRSLHKHVRHLRCERNLLQADVLFISETWQDNKDNIDHYSVPGFSVLVTSPAPSKDHRPHAGTMVYVRDELPPISCTSSSRQSGIDITVVDASSSIPGLGLVGVYSPPRVSTTTLCAALSATVEQVLSTHQYVVVGGDLNCDVTEKLPAPLASLCTRFTLQQMVKEPTSDHLSTLDLLFTNLPMELFTSGVLESWYSDHKPVFVAVRKLQE